MYKLIKPGNLPLRGMRRYLCPECGQEWMTDDYDKDSKRSECQFCTEPVESC